MKKRIVLCIAAAVLVFAAVLGIVSLFAPVNYFEDSDVIEIHRVLLLPSEDEEIDITASTDLDALKSCLMLMQCGRFSKGASSYWLGDVQYMIDGTRNGKPLHILLGNCNYVYESAEQGWYVIHNSAAWLTILDLLASA